MGREIEEISWRKVEIMLVSILFCFLIAIGTAWINKWGVQKIITIKNKNFVQLEEKYKLYYLFQGDRVYLYDADCPEERFPINPREKGMQKVCFFNDICIEFEIIKVLPTEATIKITNYT